MIALIAVISSIGYIITAFILSAATFGRYQIKCPCVPERYQCTKKQLVEYHYPSIIFAPVIWPISYLIWIIVAGTSKGYIKLADLFGKGVNKGSK